MSTITTPLSPVDFELVTVDLYRDVHKGIRSELFGVTLQAGQTDADDHVGWIDLGARIGALGDLLVGHAEHEDAVIQPVLEERRPDLAEKIEWDHHRIDARIDVLRDLAGSAQDAFGGRARDAGHRLYLELASFTGAYLEHQDVEERIVMPALEAEVGVDGAFELHGAIIASIPPDEIAQGLALMLPAMNIDDRAELLGGMQANAPAEVFAGVWALAGSVLDPSDRDRLAGRLGLGG